MTAIGDYLRDHPRVQGLSLREVANIVGVGHETVRAIFKGLRVPDDPALVKFANALPGDLTRMRTLAEADRLGEFQLPPEASRLDRAERHAVITVVNQLLVSANKTGHVPAGDTPVDASDEHTDGASVTPLRPKRDVQPERVTRAAYRPPEDL